MESGDIDCTSCKSKGQGARDSDCNTFCGTTKPPLCPPKGWEHLCKYNPPVPTPKPPPTPPPCSSYTDKNSCEGNKFSALFGPSDSSGSKPPGPVPTPKPPGPVPTPKPPGPVPTPKPKPTAPSPGLHLNQRLLHLGLDPNQRLADLHHPHLPFLLHQKVNAVGIIQDKNVVIMLKALVDALHYIHYRVFF